MRGASFVGVVKETTDSVSSIGRIWTESTIVSPASVSTTPFALMDTFVRKSVTRIDLIIFMIIGFYEEVKYEKIMSRTLS
jgi:hypothetical protein